MDRLSYAVRRHIREALAEDVRSGDRTTEWCVAKDQRADAEIVAKASGVVAGLAPAAEVFRQLGEPQLRPLISDGDSVQTGDVVAWVSGAARSVLTGERTALNFLMRLSGIATLTRRFVTQVAGTAAQITDTRKTTPLWRELEKAAVRAGGAVNHRDALDAMVLIKENHIACSGGIEAAARRVQDSNVLDIQVEVEARDLDEVRAALAAAVDRIMLDNMSVDQVADAVSAIRAHSPRPEIEASGGVTLANVRELAETGVDYVSVGALTHSAPALDFSLRVRTVES